MTRKVINFSPGPSKLPEDVLLQVQRELLDYQGAGISVMEMSHRSAEFIKIVNTAQETVRSLLDIPKTYKVLFMAAGGMGQFAAIPLNLMGTKMRAVYLNTGAWSAKAAKEAAKYGAIREIKPDLTNLTEETDFELDGSESYFYYCANETIHGVELAFTPKTNGVPLVADMSSNILTRKVDVSKFAVIFAGAQKNIGPAGVTLVIIREDFLGNASPQCPSVLNYTLMSNDNSLLNTPPCFSLYVTGLVFQWISQQGGTEAMEHRSAEKSKLIYQVIDESNGFYVCRVPLPVRSRVNVPFRIRDGDEDLEKQFIEQARKRNIIQLKGHRSVGGIRASLYNAITMEEVSVLATFMRDFMASAQM